MLCVCVCLFFLPCVLQIDMMEYVLHICIFNFKKTKINSFNLSSRHRLHIWSFYPRNKNSCPQKPIIWYVTCLYSEILPKIQEGGLKKFLPPWNFFFFMFGISRIPFTCVKSKKNLKGGQKNFFNPLSPPQKCCFYKKSHIFLW